MDEFPSEVYRYIGCQVVRGVEAMFRVLTSRSGSEETSEGDSLDLRSRSATKSGGGGVDQRIVTLGSGAEGDQEVEADLELPLLTRSNQEVGGKLQVSSRAWRALRLEQFRGQRYRIVFAEVTQQFFSDNSDEVFFSIFTIDIAVTTSSFSYIQQSFNFHRSGSILGGDGEVTGDVDILALFQHSQGDEVVLHIVGIPGGEDFVTAEEGIESGGARLRSVDGEEGCGPVAQSIAVAGGEEDMAAGSKRKGKMRKGKKRLLRFMRRFFCCCSRRR